VLDKYTLITKTNCKKIYNLIESELDGLDEYYSTGAYGNGEATYYTKDKVIERSCIKHNTTHEDLENRLRTLKLEKEQAKEEKRERRIEKEQLKREKRKDKLIDALHKSGLELRNDSVLCQHYINGISEHDVEYIVRRMSQMKFLFEYCHMDECRDIAYEEYRNELKHGYFPDCSVFDRAEYIALTKYSDGHYPLIFPWQL